MRRSEGTKPALLLVWIIRPSIATRNGLKRSFAGKMRAAGKDARGG
jgi:hypothetical protein